MFTVIWRYAVRNIARTKLRSFFTFLSIVLIITLYTVLASVANSFSDQITRFLGQKNIDLVVQSRYASSPVTSKIPPQIAEKIRQMPEITDSESLLISHKKLYGKDSIFIIGMSNSESIRRKFGFRVVEGRPFRTTTKEVIIGEKMAQIYGLSSGDTLELDELNSFTISGVYASWLNFLNAGVMVDIKQAQFITEKPDQSNLLFLTLSDPTRTSEVVSAINGQYPAMRAIDSLQFPDHLGPIKSMFYFSRIVSVFTLSIAVVVLLTSLSMAINERTKEVGILRAIGWPRRLIIAVVTLESLVLSVTAGFIGYCLSYPAIQALKHKFSSIQMYFPDSPDLDIFINVMLMCVLISLVSSVFPAVHSARIKVVKALRYE